METRRGLAIRRENVINNERNTAAALRDAKGVALTTATAVKKTVLKDVVKPPSVDKLKKAEQITKIEKVEKSEIVNKDGIVMKTEKIVTLETKETTEPQVEEVKEIVVEKVRSLHLVFFMLIISCNLCRQQSVQQAPNLEVPNA